MRSFRTNQVATCSLVIAALVLPIESARAQRSTDERVGISAVVDGSSLSVARSVVTESPVSSLNAPEPFAPRAGGEKDPFVAGLLSWVVPGVGSFYAGNSRHGVTHLVTHVASYALILGGAASCTTNYSGAATCSTSSGALVGVGFVALLVNDVWSIFTAVGDARATRTAGR